MKKKALSLPYIAFDLMGSDHPAIDHIQSFFSWDQPSLQANVLLLGTQELQGVFQRDCPKHLQSFLSFQCVEEEISMNENPLYAVRRKKLSSINIGMNLLKEKKIDAFISLGNTGALVTSAKMHLPMIFDIPRPALLALLPTLSENNKLAVLDVGATMAGSENLLVKFALMGFAYQKVMGKTKPILGLLNVGSEEKKGTPELQKTFATLKRIEQRFQNDFYFMGNIESKDSFLSSIDVLITDGFTGNVFLKTTEGMAKFLSLLFQKSFHDRSLQNFSSTLKLLEEDYLTSALLLGIEGIVLKCHGSANFLSIKQSILKAEELIHHQFLSSFRSLLSTYQENWN